VLSEHSINYSNLQPSQIVNHFEGIRQLTTKSGFAELLQQSLQWGGSVSMLSRDEVTPRCYNLADGCQRDTFMDDYRISTLLLILQWSCAQDIYQLFCAQPAAGAAAPKIPVAAAPIYIPPLLLSTAIAAVVRYNRVWAHNENIHVDSGFKCVDTLHEAGTTVSHGEEVFGLTDSQWESMYELSYSIIEFGSGTGLSSQTSGSKPSSGGRASTHSIRRMQQQLQILMNNSLLYPAATIQWVYQLAEDIVSGDLDPVAKHPTDVPLGAKGLYRSLKARVSEMYIGSCSSLGGGAADVNCVLNTAARVTKCLLLLEVYCSKVNAQYLHCNGNNLTGGHLRGSTSCSAGSSSKLEKLALSDTVAMLAASVARPFAATGCSPPIHTFRQLYVVKAPEASCGVNLKLCYKIHDILDIERRMTGRTVQKYVEGCLLAPGKSDLRAWRQQEGVPPLCKFKFDLRVWVLVTSFEPLCAYVYTRVYGRRCMSAYTTSLVELGNSRVHYTNYAVNRDKDSKERESSKGGASAVSNKLRDMCRTNRSAVTNVAPKPGVEAEGVSVDPEEALFLSHEDLIALLCLHYPELGPTSVPADSEHSPGRDKKEGDQQPALATSMLWTRLWAAIKHRIFATLECGKEHITARGEPQAQDSASSGTNTFELLGYDVMLVPNAAHCPGGDSTPCVPYILEVNMTPGLAHRGPQQNAVIRCMMEGILELVGVGKYLSYEESLGAADDENVDNFQDGGNDQVNLGEWESLIHSGNGSGAANTLIPRTDAASISRRKKEARNSHSAAQEAARTEKARQARGGLSVQQWCQLSVKEQMLRQQSFQQSVKSGGSGTSGSAGVPESGGAINNSHQQSSSSTGTVAANEMRLQLPVVGVAVSSGYVQFTDKLGETHEAVRHLQQWGRRYLQRVRFYHQQRERAAVTLQCFRRFVCAGRVVLHRRRYHACVVIQSLLRMRLASRCVVRLIQTNAVGVIVYRMRALLRREKIKRFTVNMRSKRITRWIRAVNIRNLHKMARKLQRVAAKWLQHRRVYGLIVLHCLRLMYFRNRRRRKLVHHRLRRWISRMRLNRCMRMATCRRLANEITGAGGHLHKLRQAWSAVSDPVNTETTTFNPSTTDCSGSNSELVPLSLSGEAVLAGGVTGGGQRDQTIVDSSGRDETVFEDAACPVVSAVPASNFPVANVIPVDTAALREGHGMELEDCLTTQFLAAAVASSTRQSVKFLVGPANQVPLNEPVSAMGAGMSSTVSRGNGAAYDSQDSLEISLPLSPDEEGGSEIYGAGADECGENSSSGDSDDDIINMVKHAARKQPVGSATKPSDSQLRATGTKTSRGGFCGKTASNLNSARTPTTSNAPADRKRIREKMQQLREKHHQLSPQQHCQGGGNGISGSVAAATVAPGETPHYMSGVKRQAQNNRQKGAAVGVNNTRVAVTSPIRMSETAGKGPGGERTGSPVPDPYQRVYARMRSRLAGESPTYDGQQEHEHAYGYDSYNKRQSDQQTEEWEGSNGQAGVNSSRFLSRGPMAALNRDDPVNHTGRPQATPDPKSQGRGGGANDSAVRVINGDVQAGDGYYYNDVQDSRHLRTQQHYQHQWRPVSGGGFGTSKRPSKRQEHQYAQRQTQAHLEEEEWYRQEQRRQREQEVAAEVFDFDSYYDRHLQRQRRTHDENRVQSGFPGEAMPLTPPRANLPRRGKDSSRGGSKSVRPSSAGATARSSKY